MQVYYSDDFVLLTFLKFYYFTKQLMYLNYQLKKFNIFCLR